MQLLSSNYFELQQLFRDGARGIASSYPFCSLLFRRLAGSIQLELDVAVCLLIVCLEG